jgi:hypothetical protein
MRFASIARRRCLPVLAAVFAAVRLASAQSASEPPMSALVNRVAPDDVTVRAVRLTAPLTVDGRLEEPVYTTIEPLTGFIQQEPRQGELATEKTEAWILFDDSTVYVAARCWDSQPEREVANELRRDNGNILGNENVTFVIDTLHDRRNGYLFQTNPLGALRDMTITDDQQNLLERDLVCEGGAVRAWLDREASGLFRIDFQSSDYLSFEHSQEYELLPGRFQISPGVIVPAGGYDYHLTRASYNLGQQRPVSGRLTAAGGTLYDGTRWEGGYNGRWGVTPRFPLEPTVSLNWVHLPYGEFTAHLAGTRITVTPSARMVVSSLIQWNAGAGSLTSSARLRWEYTGGSELFVVYSDGRDTRAVGFPALLNRTFAVKVTRLSRF